MDRINELKVQVYELDRKMEHAQVEFNALGTEKKKIEQEIHALNVKGLAIEVDD